MDEYPTVLIIPVTTLPNQSYISTLARNIDSEFNQWRRPLRIIRGIP